MLLYAGKAYQISIYHTKCSKDNFKNHCYWICMIFIFFSIKKVVKLREPKFMADLLPLRNKNSRRGGAVGGAHSRLLF